MKTIPVTKARSNLFKLIDEASKEHVPIQITGKR
ncbi:MAG: type II toxin-antitoxin system Phd/YefM family antitoxin [Candidatus Marinimicrobia bacterium]|nr:type II toxin-antitoxin system Phd/YefM family antitoxin [Candidatus Neomarinimicrobiota bacterium]